MKTSVQHFPTSDAQKTQQALLRAAENARRLAEQTGTPFITRSITPAPVTTEEAKSCCKP